MIMALWQSWSVPSCVLNVNISHRVRYIGMVEFGFGYSGNQVHLAKYLFLVLFPSCLLSAYDTFYGLPVFFFKDISMYLFFFVLISVQTRKTLKIFVYRRFYPMSFMLRLLYGLQ